MTPRSFVSTAREVFLTFGALLGVVCILLTVAGVTLGVQPLMFRSGSMSPAIETGDMAIARTVPAADLERGDIVSVATSTGSRVTHRVVGLAAQGDERRLTLQGDANKKPDAEVYQVDSVEQVLFTIPRAGYVVSAASSPVGVFVLGLYVAALLSLIFRRRPPADDEPDDVDPPAQRSGGSRRGSRRAGREKKPRSATRVLVRSGAVVVAASAVVMSTPAMAAPWVNSVPITGSAFTALSIPAPTAPTCTTITAGADDARIGWTSAGAGLTYRVTVTRNSNGAVLLTRNVTGTTTDILYGDLAPSPGINQDMTVTIRSVSASAPTWPSDGTVTRTIRSRMYLVLFAEVYCT